MKTTIDWCHLLGKFGLSDDKFRWADQLCANEVVIKQSQKQHYLSILLSILGLLIIMLMTMMANIY